MTTPEPTLSSPPALAPSGTPISPVTPIAPSTQPAMPPTKPRSLKWLWWSIGGILVVGIFGGGYFAYSRGFVAIPFLTPKTDTLFTKMVDSISTIKSAQYSVRAKFESQSRESGRKPFFENINVNAAVPSDLSGYLSMLNPKDALKSIPGDVKVEGGMTLFIETDKLVQDANGMFKIDGTYTGSDTSVAIDLELRKVDRNLYGIVRKFPSLFFFDLSGVKNKWVEATPDDSISDISTSTFENQDLRKSADALKAATKRALDEKLFTVKQKLPAETIAGVRSEHYLINVAPEKLEGVLAAVRDERKAQGQNVSDIESTIAEVKNPDVQKLLKSMTDNSRIEIWVDRAKGFLRQIRWGFTVVPDDSVERLKGKQLFLELTLTLDKVNENVKVDKPSPTIDFDEATRLVTGITKEQQRFDKQTSRVSALRSALSTYKSKNQSYPNSLEALNTSLKGMYDSCMKEHQATQTTKTTDSAAQSRDTTRRSDIGSFRTGLALYYDDFGVYPSALSDLVTKGYQATVPTDPQSKAQYSYTSCDGKHYVLGTTLETTTNVYYISDAGNTSSNVLTCTSLTANTNSATSGATSFSIESIGNEVGLGGYDESKYWCWSEKNYRDGVNVTDAYTNKPYEYAIDGTDYKLGYMITLSDAKDSYDKESYADGKNTATSKDTSTEKTTAYEESLKKSEENKKLTNTAVNTNVSVNTNSSSLNSYWTSLYPCLTGEPTYTGDADKDTLGDHDEIYKWYTNPCKSDTDGDGYSDSNEIINKYNPVGTGKATDTQLYQWGMQTTTSSSQTTTPTVQAPQILSQLASSAYGQATISWQTNVAADSVVNYGPTTSYGTIINNTSYSTKHTLTFPVTAGNTYHYAIRTCVSGLSPITGCTASPDYTFVAK